MSSRALSLALLASLPSALGLMAASAGAAEPGLLFYLSGDHGTTADFSAGHTPTPNFESGITTIQDGAKGAENTWSHWWRSPECPI